MYPDPFAIARDYKAGGQPLVMAARISGPVKSAFQAKPEGDNDGPDYQAEAKEPANIVVVADTDLLDDRTWLADQGMFGQSIQVPVADNAGFVANALDYLAGSDALTDLRGRDVSQRPFTRVAEIRQAAETQYRAKEQDLLQKLTDLQQKLSSARVDNAGDEAADRHRPAEAGDRGLPRPAAGHPAAAARRAAQPAPGHRGPADPDPVLLHRRHADPRRPRWRSWSG